MMRMIRLLPALRRANIQMQYSIENRRAMRKHDVIGQQSGFCHKQSRVQPTALCGVEYSTVLLYYSTTSGMMMSRYCTVDPQCPIFVKRRRTDVSRVCVCHVCRSPCSLDPTRDLILFLVATTTRLESRTAAQSERIV